MMDDKWQSESFSRTYWQADLCASRFLQGLIQSDSSPVRPYKSSASPIGWQCVRHELPTLAECLSPSYQKAYI